MGVDWTCRWGQKLRMQRSTSQPVLRGGSLEGFLREKRGGGVGHSRRLWLLLLLTGLMLLVMVVGFWELPETRRRRFSGPTLLPSRRHHHHAPHHESMFNHTSYRVGLVADMDKVSKIDHGAWMSVYKTLVIERTLDGKYRLQRMLEETPLVSRLGEGDRGMELSELLYFHGKLIALSDRTGVIYEIRQDKLVPLWIVPDGDGHSEVGFKSEWATVVDDFLYVGSSGKPFVRDGVVQNENRLWVKRITSMGQIEHILWKDVYERVRNATGTFGGFVVHEAVNFNPMDRRWYFLPRRLSAQPWSKTESEVGNHLLISCNERFEDWKTVALGTPHKGHGWSSFKFIPFREHEIVAVKTEETADNAHSHLEVIDITTGKLLLMVELGPIKYEGVAILPPITE